MENNPQCNISVIIVSYNTADFLSRCLHSIACQQGIDFEVIVIDNHSHDGTIEMLTTQFTWVKFIANDENLGFSKANNQGAAISHGKYLYFLNPDTQITDNTLMTINTFMESHPKIGLAGTKMVNPDGSPQSSVVERYPGEKYAKEELTGLIGNIAWVLGASMIVRRDIFKKLNGFDEDFFIYGEEQDLCLRIRKAGWRIGYIPDTSVIHWGGQSERNSLPKHVWEKKFKAEFTFYKKHYLKKTIRSICRSNRLQAFWRVFTLTLVFPFSMNKDIVLSKLERYRLILKTFHLKNHFNN